MGKQQHYIPESYLKAWSKDKDDKRIMIYNPLTDKVYCGSPKYQARKKWFYGKGDYHDVEEKLSKTESYVMPELKKVIQKGILPDPLTEKFKVLKTYMMMQLLRTRAGIRQVDNLIQEDKSEILACNPELKNEREIVEKLLCNAFDINSPGFDKFNDISNLELKLVVNKGEGLDFVTSDSPVIPSNKLFFFLYLFLKFDQERNKKREEFSSELFPYDMCGFLMLFPISPKHLLLLYDSETYQLRGESSQRSSVNIYRKSDIRSMNAKQMEIIICRGNGNIYCRKERDVNGLKKFTENNTMWISEGDSMINPDLSFIKVKRAVRAYQKKVLKDCNENRKIHLGSILRSEYR